MIRNIPTAMCIRWGVVPLRTPSRYSAVVVHRCVIPCTPSCNLPVVIPVHHVAYTVVLFGCWRFPMRHFFTAARIRCVLLCGMHLTLAVHHVIMLRQPPKQRQYGITVRRAGVYLPPKSGTARITEGYPGEGKKKPAGERLRSTAGFDLPS